MSKYNYITCCECGAIGIDYLCIDVWAIEDDKYYCYDCSKTLRIGWFEKLDKLNDISN